MLNDKSPSFVLPNSVSSKSVDDMHVVQCKGFGVSILFHEGKVHDTHEIFRSLFFRIVPTNSSHLDTLCVSLTCDCNMIAIFPRPTCSKLSNNTNCHVGTKETGQNHLSPQDARNPCTPSTVNKRGKLQRKQSQAGAAKWHQHWPQVSGGKVMQELLSRIIKLSSAEELKVLKGKLQSALSTKVGEAKRPIMRRCCKRASKTDRMHPFQQRGKKNTLENTFPELTICHRKSVCQSVECGCPQRNTLQQRCGSTAPQL